MSQIDDIKAQLADIQANQATAADAAANLSDDVDQLLVLGSGRLMEQGPPQELAAQPGGVFASMVSAARTAAAAAAASVAPSQGPAKG